MQTKQLLAELGGGGATGEGEGHVGTKLGTYFCFLNLNHCSDCNQRL